MIELKVSLYPDLVEPASIKSLEGTLDVEAYHVGGMTLDTPAGVQYDLLLTNAGDGIVLSGKASCDATTPCARCLVPTSIHVEGDVEGYYVLDPSEELDDYEADEFECVGEDGTFDIAPAIVAALVHATPFVVLCKEDCAGLCPKCGSDLNEGPCTCDDADDIDPLNPFAALKDLDFGEE